MNRMGARELDGQEAASFGGHFSFAYDRGYAFPAASCFNVATFLPSTVATPRRTPACVSPSLRPECD